MQASDRRKAKRLVLGAVILSALFLSSCGGAGEGDASQAPNVVLVVLDTLRLDATGLAREGSPRDSATPTLDALGESGTRSC